MVADDQVFKINDTIGVSDNLAAYARVLVAVDPALGLALKPFLEILAAGQQVDSATILNALYAATLPPLPTQNEVGSAE